MSLTEGLRGYGNTPEEIVDCLEARSVRIPAETLDQLEKFESGNEEARQWVLKVLMPLVQQTEALTDAFY